MNIQKFISSLVGLSFLGLMQHSIAGETTEKLDGKSESKQWILSDGYVVSAHKHFSSKKKSSDNAEILLLHQCNRDQTMWNDLQASLIGRGFNVTSVDYRGYGESRTANPNYAHTNIDRLKLVNDAKSIFLSWSQDFVDQRKIVVGSSCGAGLAISLTKTFQNIFAVVLISPALRQQWSGENGFDRFLRDEKLPVYVVSADGDHPEIDFVEKLIMHYEGTLHAEVLKGHEHGKPLMDKYPRQNFKISEWITEQLRTED